MNLKTGFSKLSLWSKRFWIIALISLLFTILPLLVAFIGLFFESKYLMTYHWFLYITGPIGLPIFFLSLLIAVIKTIKEVKNRKERWYKNILISNFIINTINFWDKKASLHRVKKFSTKFSDIKKGKI